MSQIRFYKYAALTLLLLNILLIGVFLIPRFLHGPPDHNRKGSAFELLQMTEQQDELFLKSAEQHIGQIKELNQAQKALLERYFEQLTKPDQTLNVDSLLNKVQDLERNKIESTLYHLQEVKALLNPDQMVNFNRFMEHVMTAILSNEKKNPPPPKDF